MGTEMNKYLSQKLIYSCLSSLLLGLSVMSLSIKAQPSGGPYGPILQTYELPKANTIYYVAPDGKEESVGDGIGGRIGGSQMIGIEACVVLLPEMMDAPRACFSFTVFPLRESFLMLVTGNGFCHPRGFLSV